ncbi:MAG: single-stranded DNA-binding protein [Chitinophagales bacterium]
MVNRVYLLGNLGKDPVIKHFPNDGMIAEFTLATSDDYKDKEGKWVDVTDWHNIKVNNRFLAERVEKTLKKGNRVFIEGKIKTRSYDDKDGNKRYITEIVADFLRLLDKKEGAQGSSSAPQAEYVSNGNQASNVDDDLPF